MREWSGDDSHKKILNKNLHQIRLPYKPGEKENWDSSGYKIFINADHSSGERIDLPGDLIHLSNYAATLGHKETLIHLLDKKLFQKLKF